MKLWNHYHLAQSIEDALRVLSGSPGRSRVIAGGTDLLLDLQQGRHPPIDTLVDISSVPELNALEIRQGRVFIGAAVPLNRIIASSLVQEHAQALVEAASLIGGPQVRNTATLGGNVAHALPAGDGTISLLALDAQAEVAAVSGQRSVPLEGLYLGPGRSALQPDEILVGFSLPRKMPGQGSAFRRVMRPQGVAIAILNLGVWLQREGETLVDVHIAVGPGGPVPLRARATEKELRGKQLTPESLEAAVAVLQSEAHFRTSRHRATAEYRFHLSAVLLEDTLMTAWQRAALNIGISI